MRRSSPCHCRARARKRGRAPDWRRSPRAPRGPGRRDRAAALPTAGVARPVWPSSPTRAQRPTAARTSRTPSAAARRACSGRRRASHGARSGACQMRRCAGSRRRRACWRMRSMAGRARRCGPAASPAPTARLPAASGSPQRSPAPARNAGCWARSERAFPARSPTRATQPPTRSNCTACWPGCGAMVPRRWRWRFLRTASTRDAPTALLSTARCSPT